MTVSTPAVAPFAYAALRDASWLSRPDVRTVKKWHVDRGNATPACSNEHSWSSRNNPFLADFTRMPVDQVAEHVRCQRPGCRVRWPTRKEP